MCSSVFIGFPLFFLHILPNFSHTSPGFFTVITVLSVRRRYLLVVWYFLHENNKKKLNNTVGSFLIVIVSNCPRHFLWFPIIPYLSVCPFLGLNIWTSGTIRNEPTVSIFRNLPFGFQLEKPSTSPRRYQHNVCAAWNLCPGGSRLRHSICTSTNNFTHIVNDVFRDRPL